MTILDLYTPKQVEILKNARKVDWSLMINHGAVRAGKTKLDNDLFLSELLQVKKRADKDGVRLPKYILGAVSKGTLQTNVLSEITNDYGIEFQFDKHGNFSLFGVYVVTTFTGSIAGLKAIRGMTSYGAYINEASLANKEVFDEILKRCSGSGARVICDTNTDHPRHWLKVDYIDRADGQRIVSNHFTIFDNPFLNQRYVDNLIATTPSGVFTDRGIYGKWVAGEGAVYKDFSESFYMDEKDLPSSFERVFVGVDWGYEHYGSIVVFGEVNGNTYLLEETAEQYQEIDYWVTQAKRIQQKYGSKIRFYADSARPEHVARFNREGIKTINANKSVLSGIEVVASLMKQGRFYVVKNKVKRFKDEIYRYVWDERTGLPVKQEDDTMDAMRYGIYSNAVGAGSHAKTFKGGI